MKVAILEIAPKGHYTYVESMVKIYAADPRNEVVIFTNTHGEKQLEYLKNKQISLIIKADSEDYVSFFEKINHFDKVFIVTLEPYARENYKAAKAFLTAKIDSPIYYVIHNIDLWFRQNLLDKIRNIGYRLHSFKEFKYRCKIYFYYAFINKKIINKVIESNGKFVTMTEPLQRELSKYVAENRVFILPFSVFNDNLKNTMVRNARLRVCIPGLLTPLRRDYDSVFQLLAQDTEGVLRDAIEWDFLGGKTTGEGGETILKQADHFTRLGYTIHIPNQDFLTMTEFDESLAKADIILGNMHLKQGANSRYGKSKETGIIFTMIKAAKPGILPSEYDCDNSLKSSIITFKNYDEVAKILIHLSQNQAALNDLKTKALENSKKYTPLSIYNFLENKN